MPEAAPILDIEEVASNGDQSPARKLRARLVSVTVGLEVVADDGETLHPMELQSARIPASDWRNWNVDAALAQVQAQLDR